MKHLFFILIALPMFVFAQSSDANAQNQRQTDITSEADVIKPAIASNQNSQDRLKLVPYSSAAGTNAPSTSSGASVYARSVQSEVTSSLPVIPSDQIHRYQPVEYASMGEPVNGSIPVLTNIGLFVTDANGTILREIFDPAGQPLMPEFILNMVASPEGDFSYINTGRYWARDGCAQTYLPSSDGGHIYRFDGDELTSVGTHSGTALLMRDPSDNFWAISSTDYQSLYRFQIQLIRGDSLVSFPDIVYGASYWYDEEEEALVVGYADNEQDIWSSFGNRFVRWDGEAFEPIDTPSLPPPNNIRASWPQYSASLAETIAAQLDWLPKNEIVTSIQESPDGSIWSLERVYHPICAAKENSGGSTTSQIDSYHFEMLRQTYGMMEESKLFRYSTGGTEIHGSWMSDSPDFYAINDMDVKPDGVPLLSGFLRLPYPGTFESRAAAWHYADVDQPLVMLPDNVKRSWIRTFQLDRANAGRYFLYANRGWNDDNNELYLLDEGELHTITHNRSIDMVLGIHPAGEGRWRTYSYDGEQIDLVLPENDEMGVPFVETIVPKDDAIFGFGTWSEDQTLWYLQYDGMLTGNRDGSEILSTPWTNGSPVTAMVQASASELWVATCGSGIIRVDVASGEKAPLRSNEGLSSECVLSLSKGPSGRLYAGTTYGYTVFGDAMEPGGPPIPQRSPVSVPDDGGAMQPVATQLLPNYPNPFNPETTVPFQVNDAGHIRITVHNVLGQQVMMLLDDVVTSGEHRVIMRADGLASGVYMVRLVHDSGVVQSRSVVLLK